MVYVFPLKLMLNVPALSNGALPPVMVNFSVFPFSAAAVSDADVRAWARGAVSARAKRNAQPRAKAWNARRRQCRKRMRRNAGRYGPQHLMRFASEPS